MPPVPFNCSSLLHSLRQDGRAAWAETVDRKTRAALQPQQNGHLDSWLQLLQQVPECPDAGLRVDGDHVAVDGTLSEHDRAILNQQLKALHPWRKGPFRFFGTTVDTEWRSSLKWDRLAQHVRFDGRRILDVGCGNGYYGWRMLLSGAAMVVGLDPFLLYAVQFELLRKFCRPETPHWVLPLQDNDLPDRLDYFDLTFSMGVLYHRSGPIDHLLRLRNSLRPGGELILETLILEGDGDHVLVPEDRYARMRNVWFIPTTTMLAKWLRRAGFRNIDVLDISATTIDEQRKTEWMTFDSLSDFLDPEDSRLTIEGYPAPVRAIMRATRPGL